MNRKHIFTVLHWKTVLQFFCMFKWDLNMLRVYCVTCKLLKCSLHHPSKTELEGEMSHWKSQSSGACEVTVSFVIFVQCLVVCENFNRSVCDLLVARQLSYVWNLVRNCIHKFIRFNTVCSLWQPCLMLLKVLIFSYHFSIILCSALIFW